MEILKKPIATLAKIPKTHAKRLEKMGIFTVGDLLRHFPTRYEDLSIIQTIEDAQHEQTITIIGKVRSFESKRSWKRKLLISEIVLEDATGYIRLIFFGQRFLENTFREGNMVRVSGKVEWQNEERTMASPEFELASRRPTHTGCIVGIYPETYGITSKWLRWNIQTALEKYFSLMQDPIPQDILDRYHLPPLSKAFKDIHFPKTLDHALVAKKRFAFEEMFFLQLRIIRAGTVWEQSLAPSFSPPLSPNDYLKHIPFTLTNDQYKAFLDILEDTQKSHPMNRLLNGDVGSGKTAVALLGALHSASNTHQCVFLAPTEVLALQHFQTAKKFLRDSDLSVALLTHSYQNIIHLGAGGEVQKLKRDQLLRAIKENVVHLVIGTHALLQKDIAFSKLGLIVVDEQHRFGVKQRSHLQKHFSQEKEITPHLLSMTATPIPRTLSLSLFGNLDISLLTTPPKGRKKIQTSIIPPNKRGSVYTFVRSEITKGRQVYVILPLVEESEAFTGTKAATEECKRLQEEVFVEYRVGLLHGKMKSKEKEKIMQAFKEREIDILVATAVVEVGVDVPNATLMLIEEAQRFGLSQLHQFRGRIGRGKHQSYCFLFSGDDSDGPSRRMRILEKSSDGFAIAEEDLKLRGPGEFFGSKQSGLPDIGMENLMNIKLITFAKKEASTLLAKDPTLKNTPFLQESMKHFEENLHLE